MWKLLGAWVVGCLAIAPAAAQATEIVRSDSGDVGWYAAAIHRAHVPGPPTTIELIVGPSACPVAPSCAQAGSPPRIFFDPIAAVPQKQTWLHEVGHVFDYTTMREGDRNYFRRVIGDRRPWRSPPNSPHEKFAEAYSMCARDSRSPHRMGGDRYEPTVAQHRRVCRMIRKAGGWR